MLSHVVRVRVVRVRMRVIDQSNKNFGLYHGIRRTKVGPWMPGTGGVVLAHQGVGHLTEGLLTLHNLLGDAGINDE